MKKEDRNHRQYFPSFGAYTAYVANSPERNNPLNDEGDAAHYGTATFAEALDLAATGWIEGAARIKHISTPIVTRIASRIERADVVYDVEGAGLDVARYLDGEPECWQRWQPTVADGPGRILRIGVNLALSFSVPADVFITRGAVIVALIEALEFSGYRVAVDAIVATCSDRVPTPRSSYDVGTIRVKDADQPLDLPRLAYVISHPAVQRRLGFAYLRLGPVGSKDPTGLGYPYDPPEQDRYDIYFQSLLRASRESDWSNPASAQAFVQRELAKQGIKIQDSRLD